MQRVVRESGSKPRTKSIYVANKSHTTSMHIRVSQDLCETPLKETSHRAEGSRSRRKDKHSIVLQDSTLSKPRLPETDRGCREVLKYKRSIDQSNNRLKTDVNDDLTDVTCEELRLFAHKINAISSKKQTILKELLFYKKYLNLDVNNSVLKILRK